MDGIDHDGRTEPILVFLQYCSGRSFWLQSATIHQVLLCAHHALPRHP